mmetsp:Transcript_39321/g.111349  ORF Transcript_39321/g.111349 Transcript_39321/m.111349 type:complete len:206 (+) Transcript_39321:3290-3907(+)
MHVHVLCEMVLREAVGMEVELQMLEECCVACCLSGELQPDWIGRVNRCIGHYALQEDGGTASLLVDASPMRSSSQEAAFHQKSGELLGAGLVFATQVQFALGRRTLQLHDLPGQIMVQRVVVRHIKPQNVFLIVVVDGSVGERSRPPCAVHVMKVESPLLLWPMPPGVGLAQQFAVTQEGLGPRPLRTEEKSRGRASEVWNGRLF